MPRRYPAVGIAGCSRVGRIEGRLEAVAVELCQLDVMNAIVKRGEHDFRREWQRRRHGPWRDSAVVGSVRYATSHVIEERALDADYVDGVRTGNFARDQSPTVLVVVGELDVRLDEVVRRPFRTGLTLLARQTRAQSAHAVDLVRADVFTWKAVPTPLFGSGLSDLVFLNDEAARSQRRRPMMV